jgi:anthranilate phosphoribosyltransferase
MLKNAIQKLLRHEDFTEQEIMSAMNIIMDGNATQAQIGGFLTALRIKGETIDEITGCARVMREKAERINPKVEYCIDTCGTGGDGANTFNISTVSALIAAAGGVVVAKHGNRAMSSRSGSADVLEALGVNISLTPGQVSICIEDLGIGFMFAQAFHKSMKHAAGPRRELGIKTVFNILGPLTNPAGVNGQVLGVFDENLTEMMASVLLKLGIQRAMVVHGMDGLDEISTVAKTKVTELKDGVIKSYYLDASDYGLARASSDDLKGGDGPENAEIARSIFKGEKGPRRDIVLINAAAALYVGKAVDDLSSGIRLAEEMIDSGKAYAKLEELCDLTKSMGSEQVVSA